MKKHLYFVCPTDYIEPIINNSSKCKNYYYTSLGNSVIFNKNNIHDIESLLRKHDIKDIFFVLSDRNPIVSDALGKQHFSEIRGLNNFYNEIIKQKERSEVLWQINNPRYLMLSYYLNKKIKELQTALNNLLFDDVKINGQIYNQQKQTFSIIYFDLLFREDISLN